MKLGGSRGCLQSLEGHGEEGALSEVLAPLCNVGLEESRVFLLLHHPLCKGVWGEEQEGGVGQGQQQERGGGAEEGTITNAISIIPTVYM